MYDKNQILNYIQEVGICVLEDYYSREECEECVSDIDRCMVEYKDKIQKHAEKNEDNNLGDERLFKIENQSNLAHKFSNDSLILNVATSYYGFESTTVQVLGQRLIYDQNNLNSSGGGWHVDSKGTKQLKSIVYLTDVDEDNGPFMFLPNSKNLDLPLRNDSRGRNTRFTDVGIDNCGIEPFIVTGKKGTLVIVDTTYVHRGGIIKKGNRYALTSYLQKNDQAIDGMKRKWGGMYIPKN